MAPEAIRRTVTPETAATLTAIMEGVVERGTAKTAQIDGYTIAGKTGTAAKLEDGAYSKQKYNSSFVGFFPSRKPMLTVLVVIDTPRDGALLRRRRGRPGLQAHRRSRDPATRHAAHHQSRSAGGDRAAATAGTATAGDVRARRRAPAATPTPTA